MATAVKTSVTELPESRVRVEAEVPADEVERRLAQTAKQLGRELKIPGFRKGKVPPPVVVRRIGRAAVLDETVRGSLPSWYVDAIDAAGIVPVGDPKLDLGDLPDEGQPLTFSIEIGVRPTATLGEYKGLEVGRREALVGDDAIDEQVQGMRERLARLETVEEAAAEGDFVVVDVTGSIEGEPFPGGEARDEMIELGSGRLLEEIETALVGASAADERAADVAFPDDHPSETLKGKTASFAVVAKEVKRKLLPELDDDFAVDAAGFDTLAELREDVRQKLTEQETTTIDGEFRQAAVDAAVAEATIDVPEALVEAKAAELWGQLSQTLAGQGISREQYLQISGKTEEEMVQEARPDAEQALRREAVLAAVVEAEGIEATEDELLEALEHSAEHEKTTAAKLLERLRSAGRADTLAADIARRKAVDVIADATTAIPVDQAQARDKLWTPEKEPAERGELWTPDS